MAAKDGGKLYPVRKLILKAFEMVKGHRKAPAASSRTRVTEYALLTVLVSLGLFACMAFLRFGSG